ncbi:membrane protein [Tistrella bauzanensis]|uniref:Membrane protein n=1 Tax=Tistrella bauzanensis TaxID=657419 RepID=A0ABQ1ITV8_9PROT|nr:lipid A deacylase LpxR family protein [Tistrella bauzanensis]GGB51170.1 membrane protein [Tistrella bauzanensis]
MIRSVSAHLCGSLLAGFVVASFPLADAHAQDATSSGNTGSATTVVGTTDGTSDQPVDMAHDAEGGTFSLVFENDVVSNTDRHYTNGFRLSYMTAPGQEPEWLRKAAGLLPYTGFGGDIRVVWSLGQSMYTPGDTSLANPLLSDRPYAGWLYGSVGVVAETGGVLDQLELSLGVVGPSSLAEQTQKTIHDLIDSDDPQGWDTQLKDEPAIQLTYQKSWRALAAGSALGFAADVTPHAGFALGNVFTYANTGFTMRVGQDLPRDYGPPRISPSLPGSTYFRPTSNWGWYLFAGVDGRAVAQNIFLDGNTWKDSRSVDKKPLVGDLQAGLAITIGGTRFGYTHIFRTKEFDGQDEGDQFGAFSVSFNF